MNIIIMPNKKIKDVHLLSLATFSSSENCFSTEPRLSFMTRIWVAVIILKNKRVFHLKWWDIAKTPRHQGLHSKAEIVWLKSR